MPALTLAVLLSIDTLKTCVVLDALTRSRHDPNRELVAQGLGNMAAAAVGGVPGAGTMGATLVNISSGASSRLSGVIEGALALAAFLLLGALIAWIPIAALAGILIVVGVRMIDRNSLHFLRSPSTILDFIVILAVVVVALTVSLIAASGVGIVLAILLFGTTDQLYSALDAEIKVRKYVILDMRRLQSVDITAAHMLEPVKDILAERRSFLLLSHIPKNLPSGKDIQQYFDQIGLVRAESPVRVFNERDDAIEWVEDRILEEATFERAVTPPLELAEFDLFRGRKEENMADLRQDLRRAQRAAIKLLIGLSSTLSTRLRYANAEIGALE